MNFTRGRYPEALEAGERLLETARSGDDTGQLLEGHHALWSTLSAMGRPLQGLVHAQQGIALYDRDRHAAQTFLYGSHDPGACCRFHSAMARWLAGYPERAVRDLQDALRLAEELKHPLTTAIALWFAAWVHYQRGERNPAVASVERAVTLARQHAFPRWTEYSTILHECLRKGESMDIDALTELSRQSTLLAGNWYKAFCLCVVAEFYADLGRAEEGLQIVRSVTDAERTHCYAPELFRVEGDLLLKCERPSLDDAKRRFHEAIELARSQEEKSLELRAATSLARLLDGQGRREDAHAALAGVYGWFTEGFDTADLKAAKALLDTLS